MELFLCCYCLRVIKPPLKITTEHLLPLCEGGADNKENTRTCCHECNEWRGDRSYDNWISQLKKMIKRGNTPYYYEKIIEQCLYYKDYCKNNFNKIYKERNG